MNNTCISICDVSKSFGGIHALNNISLDFHPGRIYCLIGPNGAGKTTLFDAMTGFEKVDHGRVLYGTLNLTNMTVKNIADLGIRRTFQEVRHFWKLLCEENLIIGAISGSEPGFWKTIFRPGKANLFLGELTERVSLSLRKHGFDHLVGKPMKETSYGEMKIIEMLRCIMSDADYLLLDEPLSGLQTDLKTKIVSIISKLRDAGKTVVVIEHDYKPVFEIADFVILMNHGEIVLQDTPESVESHPVARQIYIRKASVSCSD